MFAIRAVQTKLRPQEECVYSRVGGFTLPNQSVVGTHSLYITNEGRVFAHDTGGLFGDEQVEIYDGLSLGVKVSFDTYTVKLENESYGSRLSFSFTMNISEFITLFSKTKTSIFKIPSAAPYRCYMRDAAGHYKFAEVRFKPDLLLVNGSEVPFRRIKQMSMDPNCMVDLAGSFMLGNQEAKELHIFLPYVPLLKQLVEAYQQAPKMTDLVGEQAVLFPVRFSGLLDGKKLKEASLTLAAEPDRLWLVDESCMQVVASFSRHTEACYYSSGQRSLLVVKEDKPYVIGLLKENAAAYLCEHFVRQDQLWWPKAGKLYGVWNGIKYEGETVDVMGTSAELRFLQSGTMTFLEAAAYDRIGAVIDDQKWFLQQDRQIALLVLNKGAGLEASFIGKELSERRLEGAKLGYFPSMQPFIWQHTGQELSFSQSPEGILEAIPNTALKEISALEPIGSSLFVKVQLETSLGKSELHLPGTEIQYLIQQSYVYKKLPLLQELQGRKLFLSWGRMVNDFTLYELFGQLISMGEGIQEIHSMNESADQRNLSLANFLYHGIQAQKKRMDQIAVYLPALLEQEDRKLLDAEGQPLGEQPYRKLQQQLIGICSQMRRSLNEVESALSAVSFAIIPRVDMDKLIQAKANKRYAAAGGLGVAGLLFPPLLIGAGFMAINTYLMKGDMRLQQEMQLQNEKYRLEFYVHKALDSFDHMMKTLYPYYIAESNRALYETMRQVAAAYQPVIDGPAVKQALFERLAQYHTFKQMPIDDSVAIKRQALIDQVHGAAELSQLHITSIQQEVQPYVPQSIPKLG